MRNEDVKVGQVWICNLLIQGKEGDEVTIKSVDNLKVTGFSKYENQEVTIYLSTLLSSLFCLKVN